MKASSRTVWMIPLIKGVLAFFCPLATVVLINLWVAGLRIKDQPLPEYATWTGIATLERKLAHFQKFADQGAVDAVIIGASISDHGISAEVLSRDLSAAYKRPFRVFNLSTGGASATTFYTLYRLARMIVKPKQLWIAYPVEPNTGDDVNDKSADYSLLKAPVGNALRHPSLLPLSFRVYQIPLVRHAAALRDLVFQGAFINRPSSQLDIYGFDSFGDSRGFLYYSKTEPPEKYADLRRALVLSLAHQYATATDEHNQIATYFSRSTLDAIAEVRSLTARDSCSIKILAVDSVAGFTTQDREYLDASEVFYLLLSKLFDAPVIDVRASFSLAGYKWADPSHLNSNGADEISSLMAARIADHPLPQFPDYAATPEVLLGKPVSKITPFTAVILQRPSEPTVHLKLNYVQGPGVQLLRPGMRLQAAILLPDNSSITVPAIVASRGQVLADTSCLPESTRGRVLLLQLISAGAKWGNGMNQPLASYQWSSQKLRQEDVESTMAVAKIFTDKSSYKPLERITVHWSGVDHATSKDWIGIFPVAGDESTRISMDWTGGGRSGTLQIQANLSLKAGRYEIRLYENEGWNLIASSKPFTVDSLSGSLEVSAKEVNRGCLVRGTWSNLEHADKDDWIGLFPQGGSNTSRLDFKFTGGTADGAIELSVPFDAPLGPHELRFYPAGGWNVLVTSAPFQVVAAKVQLSADRSVVQTGGMIKVKWHNLDSSQKDDWIGLFPKGQKENFRTVFQRTEGRTTGELNFVIPPDIAAGDYEFRLYAHDSRQWMANSNPFRIEVLPTHRSENLPNNKH